MRIEDGKMLDIEPSETVARHGDLVVHFHGGMWRVTHAPSGMLGYASRYRECALAYLTHWERQGLPERFTVDESRGFNFRSEIVRIAADRARTQKKPVRNEKASVFRVTASAEVFVLAEGEADAARWARRADVNIEWDAYRVSRAEDIEDDDVIGIDGEWISREDSIVIAGLTKTDEEGRRAKLAALRAEVATDADEPGPEGTITVSEGAPTGSTVTITIQDGHLWCSACGTICRARDFKCCVCGGAV
jgi:hypothetical protein